MAVPSSLAPEPAVSRMLAAATALAALTVTAPVLRAQGTPKTTAPTVAIMYFNNGALVDHDAYEAMSKGMADILITEMKTNASIRVIERDALQKLLEEQNLGASKRTDPATSARLGKILGAQHMILGGFFVDRKGNLRLDARAVNVETSEIEHVETTSGKADDVLDVIGQLAQKLNAGLKLPGRPEGTQRLKPSPSSSASAPTTASTAQVSPFKAMMTYARALSEDDAQNKAQAVALYKQFLSETKPTYAVAQRQKAEERVRVLSAGD